jgi:large subunit ribosomal protein L25
MQSFEINAELRTNKGKGASRRLRRTGKVPGILYGTEKEPVSIQVDHDSLMHHLENEAFYSHILTLKIGKDTEEVVLRDLQRHPYKPKLMHIDLQRIRATEEITMRVPIHILNETTCPGVKDERGIVTSLMTQLEVICLPKYLPEYIEIDIAAMHVGDTVHLADLKLPEGVELEILASGGDANQAVLSIQPPQVEEVESGAPAAPAAPASNTGKTE